MRKENVAMRRSNRKNMRSIKEIRRRRRRCKLHCWWSLLPRRPVFSRVLAFVNIRDFALISAPCISHVPFARLKLQQLSHRCIENCCDGTAAISLPTILEVYIHLSSSFLVPLPLSERKIQMSHFHAVRLVQILSKPLVFFQYFCKTLLCGLFCLRRSWWTAIDQVNETAPQKDSSIFI
jgi:hypothetical protein